VSQKNAITVSGGYWENYTVSCIFPKLYDACHLAFVSCCQVLELAAISQRTMQRSQRSETKK